MASLDEMIKQAPKDEIIGNNLIRAYSKINDPKYKKIVCTISGGYDSDIVLDICSKCDESHKIDYLWFDTGIEYEATKEHLKQMDNHSRTTAKQTR